MIKFNLPRVEDLQIDSGSDLDDTLHKLNEETGELSGEILAYKCSKNGGHIASATALGTPVSVVDEACDVINTAMGIIYFMLNEEPSVLTDSLVNAIFDKKLDKWESKVLNGKPKTTPEPNVLPPWE